MIRYTFLAILTAMCTASCESFVETDAPTSQLAGEEVFEDVATARAALANSYALLSNSVMLTGSIQGLSVSLGNYADELVPYGSGVSEQALFQNNLTAANADISALWNNSYNLIYAINAVIEGVGASSEISDVNKETLIGEAILIRSLVYFYLTNLFGEIPYTTTTDYVVNANLGKISVSEVYQRLEENLNEAYQMLPEDYGNMLRTTPNKSVAAAMLARLYLYAGQWDDAAEKAGIVINNTTLYTIESNIEEAFLKESRSTLWQLSPFSEGQPTRDAQSFIFTSGPPPARALNAELVEAFEAGDLRRSHWIGEVTDGGSVWYYANKYKQLAPLDISTEYTIAVRLEELYLIRAEARARTGDFSGAGADLNTIRQRAGLQDTEASSTAGLLDAIMRERRQELFSEQGHRWFDLKRTGTADNVLSLSKPGWNPTDLLWPLPQNELLLNPALVPQNPGY